MCQYKGASCRRKDYKRKLCKDHFVKYVRTLLRKTIRALYLGAEKAFGAIDHTGLGYVTQDAFLQSYVAQRVPLTSEEINEYFFLENVYKDGDRSLIYDKFKNLFFPHLTMAGDEPEKKI